MLFPFKIVLPLFVFLFSMVGTRLAINVLFRRGVIDHPNSRSSHSHPTPRGGGIVLTTAALTACLLIGNFSGSEGWPFFVIGGIGFILAGVSWIDDIRNLNPVIRLLAQGIAVGLTLYFVPLPGPIFAGLFPPFFDVLLASVLWIWFINLFNFMDGIDGLAGVETITISAGCFVISRKLGLGEPQMVLSLCLGAAALGFLRWNWYPARIFLGDVGSVPLGYILGWMLLQLAASGAWIPAVILPLYFFADATITLIRRLISREKFWQAHREHFYQRAVKSGLRHDQVSWMIGVANLFLIMLAIVAARGLGIAALLAAIGAVSVLLFLLVKGGPTD